MLPYHPITGKSPAPLAPRCHPGQPGTSLTAKLGNTSDDPAGLFATRRGASPIVRCGWLMIVVRSPSPRPAAEWCGHVDAAAAVAGGSRAHGESRAIVVPEGESGDADPRGAG